MENKEIVEKKEYSDEDVLSILHPSCNTAKEAADFLATQSALTDEALAEDLTNAKKEELRESANANLKKEKAENKNAETILQIANFGVYEGVANYAGIRKPLPKKMQSFLFTILSIIQTIWLIAVGVPTSVVVIVADCVDVIAKKLSSIAKSARWCVIGILSVAFIYAVVIIAMHFMREFGII